MSECHYVGGGCALVVFYYFSGLCYRKSEIAPLKYGRQCLNAAFPIFLFVFHKVLLRGLRVNRDQSLMLQSKSKTSPPKMFSPAPPRQAEVHPPRRHLANCLFSTARIPAQLDSIDKGATETLDYIALLLLGFKGENK